MRTDILSCSDDVVQYLQSYYNTVHPDGKGSASRYHCVCLGEPVVPYDNAARAQPLMELLGRLGELCRIHYGLVIRPSASGSSLRSEQLDFSERRSVDIPGPSDGISPSESLHAPLNTHEAVLEGFKQALEYDRLQQWQMPKMRSMYWAPQWHDHASRAHHYTLALSMHLICLKELHFRSTTRLLFRRSSSGHCRCR
ncbi:hypothetical protein NUW54_g10256 [Trametes sanguinea]|uniref:Uncharacterized protein n=1 Tax=Trametes sanguinea TaxID=158606 RepID=A0ACC1P304_9APHY|nr:hypothetical protein NUW54_g10256 [Trametes sanguinea]